jgi:hypothetical protein
MEITNNMGKWNCQEENRGCGAQTEGLLLGVGDSIRALSV